PVTDYESAKKADTARFARFFWAMMDRGFYLPCSQFEAAFNSVLHTEQRLHETLAAAREALAQGARGGRWAAQMSSGGAFLERCDPQPEHPSRQRPGMCSTPLAALPGQENWPGRRRIDLPTNDFRTEAVSIAPCEWALARAGATMSDTEKPD